MRASTSVLVALALALASSGALAQRGKPKPELPADIETAEQLYAKLDYEQANSVSERVLKDRGLTHDHLVRAYKILAVTHAVLDHEDQAREAFLKLLVYDPDYQVDPNLGPKVNTPFVEARGQFRGLATKPGVEVAAIVRSDGGQLRITTRDPTRIVRKVSVGYRWTSTGTYHVSQIVAGDGIPVEVVAAPPGRTRLDFYAQALDDRENAVFEAGNAAVPKSAFAESVRNGGGGGRGGATEKEGGSVFSSPVFWTVTTVAVIGGSLAAFFLLRPEDPPTRGNYEPTLFCGNSPCQ